MLKRLILVSILCIPAGAFAAGGFFHIANDALFFPDGSSLTKAPLDGKTILSGTGSPTVNNVVANIGDFYLDTVNNMLYGPYSGSWGAGVSLVGPPGPKGNTGAQGIQGIQGVQGNQGPKGDTGATGASPFTLNGTSALYTAGSVGIGTSSPATAAALDVSSTSKGFLPPRVTTAQRDAIASPPAGLMVYNTTTGRPNFYNGSAWNALAVVQQELLGQTVGTSGFNTNMYYMTGYTATRSGTISSVDLRVNSTGTFRLLIKNASRATVRSGPDIPVSTTGDVTIPFAPVSMLAGEYLGFYYSGTTTFTSGTGTTYYGSSDPPSNSSSGTQVSISAVVSSIN